MAGRSSASTSTTGRPPERTSCCSCVTGATISLPRGSGRSRSHATRPGRTGPGRNRSASRFRSSRTGTATRSVRSMSHSSRSACTTSPSVRRSSSVTVRSSRLRGWSAQSSPTSTRLSRKHEPVSESRELRGEPSAACSASRTSRRSSQRWRRTFVSCAEGSRLRRPGNQRLPTPAVAARRSLCSAHGRSASGARRRRRCESRERRRSALRRTSRARPERSRSHDELGFTSEDVEGVDVVRVAVGLDALEVRPEPKLDHLELGQLGEDPVVAWLRARPSRRPRDR